MDLLFIYFTAGFITLVVLLIDHRFKKMKRHDDAVFIFKNSRKTEKDFDFFLELSVRIFIAPAIVVIIWPYVLLYIALDYRRELRKKRLNSKVRE